MAWNDLTMSEKNSLMQIFLGQDITSLDGMRTYYNTYSKGGSIHTDSSNYVEGSDDGRKGENVKRPENEFKLNNKSLEDSYQEVFDRMNNYKTFNYRKLYEPQKVNPNNEDRTTELLPSYNLPAVSIEAEHPLWSLPGYRDKKNNPNVQAHKRALYKMLRNHEEAGKEYLNTIGNIGAAMSTLVDGPVGVGLGLIDITNDVQNFVEDPSVLKGVEVLLDAPIRYGAALSANKLDDIIIPFGKANDLYNITGNSILGTIDEKIHKKD